MMEEEFMQEEGIYSPMAATPEEDVTIYGHLREYLLGQVKASAPKEVELNEDADWAFVITAFARPKNPATFAGLTPRMSKVLALHSFILQVCPSLELSSDGQTRSDSVMRTGVHAVAAQILVNLMTTRIMENVVHGARSMMATRESGLHD